MNISAPFIRRPVMTVLLVFTILISGLWCFNQLPVSDLPNVDFPVIAVQVAYPGANADTMANLVATPLEREFMTIPGIENVTSTSNVGFTQVILQFEVSKSMDGAAQDVQAAILRSKKNLPQDLPTDPIYRKVNPAIAPILYIALTSDSVPLDQLYTYADTYIGQRLAMISGVAQVFTYGSPFAIRVQVNPDTIAILKVTLKDIASALQKGNPNIPVGQLDGNLRSATIISDLQIPRAEPYNDLIVAYREKGPLRIKDLGKAINSLREDRYDLRYVDKEKNQKTVVLAILRQPGANTVEVSDLVNAALPKLLANLPPSVDLKVVFDKSISIRASVEEVELTLLIAFALVVVIIFLSLGKLRDTIIPSLALPVSLIGTFIVMYMMDYSVDNLSLLALILAIGFIVDDAIVVVENIVRHVEKGETPYEAAINGSAKIGFTIWSITLSLIAVFIPLLLMGGVVGRIFREFSVTLSTITLISGMISLSFTPMLCSRFIKRENGKPTFVERFAAFMNNSLLRIYKPMLETSLNHRWIPFLMAFGSVVVSLYLFVILPKDFIPDEDIGYITVTTESQEGTSSEQMVKYQSQIVDIFSKDPAVSRFVSIAASPTYRKGNIYLFLTPREERDSIAEVIQSLRKKVIDIPGINTYFRNVPLIDLTLGASSAGSYQYMLKSVNTESLYPTAEKFKEEMEKIPIFQGVKSDMEIRTPQLKIEVDRDKAYTLGVSAEDVETALQLSYSGGRVTRISTNVNQYDVILELDRSFQRSPSALNTIYVGSSLSDKLVPLSAVATWKMAAGPDSINHSSQFPSVTLSFNLAPGVPLSAAVEEIDKIQARIVPENVIASIKGAGETFQKSSRDMPLLLLASILAIYIILGILYENFIHPLTILSTLPPAAVGALLTLKLLGYPLSLYSFLGVILLLGIVKKNGIMIVDFAIDNQREHGQKTYEAVVNACMVRFRPIMMTTLAAVMGALPIILATGIGADSRRPLGWVIVGGLLFSQLITLLVTPALYIFMDKYSERFSFKNMREELKEKKPQRVQGEG